jgi:hypothetical protein
MKINCLPSAQPLRDAVSYALRARFDIVDFAAHTTLTDAERARLGRLQARIYRSISSMQASIREMEHLAS